MYTFSFYSFLPCCNCYFDSAVSIVILNIQTKKLSLYFELLQTIIFLDISKRSIPSNLPLPHPLTSPPLIFEVVVKFGYEEFILNIFWLINEKNFQDILYIIHSMLLFFFVHFIHYTFQAFLFFFVYFIHYTFQAFLFVFVYFTHYTFQAFLTLVCLKLHRTDIHEYTK